MMTITLRAIIGGRRGARGGILGELADAIGAPEKWLG